ncbi:methyltransferase domain-containing protein [Bradyrhizobium sp. UFLA05-109]
MPEQSDPYVLGGTQTEQERLVAQAAEFEPQSRWLLDQMDIRPGWRALDVGCGPIGIVNLLSERVGAEGSVVGLEREQRFVAMARSEIARRGLQNVEVVQADAMNTGLQRSSFDFVHERLVTINVPAREAVGTGLPKIPVPDLDCLRGRGHVLSRCGCRITHNAGHSAVGHQPGGLRCGCPSLFQPLFQCP